MRRRRNINLALFGIGALMCGSCTVNVSPSSIAVGNIVQVRPDSTIGPPLPLGDWRVIDATISKTLVRTVRKTETTVHVEISDCGGKQLFIDELYASGIPLNQLSTLNDTKYAAFYATLPERVKVTLYLDERIYQNESHICALVTGGSMTGFRVTGQPFQLK